MGERPDYYQLVLVSFEGFRTWTNENQGLLSVALFLVAALFGWISGIFSGLRKKPSFKMRLLSGPNFCCTYPTGQKYGERELHRTAIALYLSVANVGSAAATIQRVSIGYRPGVTILRWLRRWRWLPHPVVALEDFRAMIGDNAKLFPFLFQMSFISMADPDTYLRVGDSKHGVVYFEDMADGWGAARPIVRDNGHIDVKVQVIDVFGRAHRAKFPIPVLPLEEARRFSPAIGRTIAQMRGEILPADASAAAENIDQ